MKEYLNKMDDFKYELVVGYENAEFGAIEIPCGANEAFKSGIDSPVVFSRSGCGYNRAITVWKRPTHPEPLPFIDDNPQSLNDQYAEIEQVRQNQKTTDAIREAEGILIQKHSHYRKSVKHLDFIDPYRIAQLYELHPCADHIAKKALCTGKRGHKDLIRDIQDIIDTAERWKQMIQEDQNAL